MSPLARSLLALACAALLHASSADVKQCVEANPSNPISCFPCPKLDMGIIDDNDHNLRRANITPYFVPPKNRLKNYLINVPNEAKSDEKLVGQVVTVCDALYLAKVTLEPAQKGKHSPLKVHCEPACVIGVSVFAHQYAIKTIT